MKDVSPKTFEELAEPPNPIAADEIAKLAQPDVPRTGYISSYGGMTDKGRERIAEDAGKRGLENFPPARQMLASDDIADGK